MRLSRLDPTSVLLPWAQKAPPRYDPASVSMPMGPSSRVLGTWKDPAGGSAPVAVGPLGPQEGQKVQKGTGYRYFGFYVKQFYHVLRDSI